VGVNGQSFGGIFMQKRILISLNFTIINGDEVHKITNNMAQMTNDGEVRESIIEN
jgi:hypothetical protein